MLTQLIRPKVTRVREYLSTALWFIPAVMLVAGAGLSEATLQIDERAAGVGPFAGGASTASDLLTSIAATTLTLTAVVFSMTMVVLQLASSQYSPRTMRTFLQHNTTKLSLGIFIATFGYSMLGLRSIRTSTDSGGEFIPSLTVTTAFGMATVSVVVFVVFIHHISQSIRVTSLIAAIRDDAESAISRCWPELGSAHDDDLTRTGHVAGGSASPLPCEVSAWASGYVSRLDWIGCARLAERFDTHVAVEVKLGQFVHRDTVLLRHAASDAHDAVAQAARPMLDIVSERTTTHDPRYGFRQLVDIGDRALSPGINDPSTATHALDRIFELLQIASSRRIAGVDALGADDRDRVSGAHHSFESLVHLSFDELRLSGSTSLQFAARLREVLDELLASVPAARRSAIQAQRDLLDETVERSIQSPGDRARVAEHNLYF